MHIKGLTKTKIWLNKHALLRLILRAVIAILISAYMNGILAYAKGRAFDKQLVSEILVTAIAIYFPVTIYQWLHKVIDKAWVCVLLAIGVTLGFIYIASGKASAWLGLFTILIILIDVLSCFIKETLNPKTKFTASDIIFLIQQGRVTDPDIVLYAALLKPLEKINSDPEKARAEAYSQLLEYRRKH